MRPTKRNNRFRRLVFTVTLAVLLAGGWGCGGSVAYHDDDLDAVTDTSIDTSADTSTDTTVPDGTDVVADTPVDTVDDDVPPFCPEGEIRCVDGGAQRCVDGTWMDLGPCPLGCDDATGACFVPSNVPADLVDPTAGDLDTTGLGPMVRMDTDDGSIMGEGGMVIRPPVTGHDAGSGITFVVHSQGEGLPAIGVFSVGSLTVPPGMTLRAEGSNALAILASGSITVAGIIDVSATGPRPGPGGGPGGEMGEPGQGACPGQSALGTALTTHHCSAGGGGGGFGGTGGAGGDAETECSYPGGAGGGPCGSAQLSPLQGGSGGGGGGLAQEDEAAFAGTGGGGGGAVQLVAVTSIYIADGGGIRAAGDGGGECNTSGGGGGGAGGGVLLESASVTVTSGGIIAANGGGGGAGDCT